MTPQQKLSETIRRANDPDRQSRLLSEAAHRVAAKRATRAAPAPARLERGPDQ